MESVKGCQPKKAKKKQVKDETDRMKQAEKKRRRLEKALATSAAIRSELEKKKQQKKEEQERLDEEGAAIAEAVALHVLLGEDSDDPRIVLGEDYNNFGDWHHAANLGLFLDGNTLSHSNINRCGVENVDWVPMAFGNGFGWNHYHYGELDPPSENFHIPHIEDGVWFHDDISAGLMAAQAVRSLQIGEDAQVGIPVFFNTY